MKRLTAVDPMFRALDVPGYPLHGTGVVFVEPTTAPGPLTFERLIALFEERLAGRISVGASGRFDPSVSDDDPIASDPVPAAAPASFNRASATAPHRNLAITSFPLDEVKRLGQAEDATVNDVFLSIVDGAVRRARPAVVRGRCPHRRVPHPDDARAKRSMSGVISLVPVTLRYSTPSALSAAVDAAANDATNSPEDQ